MAGTFTCWSVFRERRCRINKFKIAPFKTFFIHPQQANFAFSWESKYRWKLLRCHISPGAVLTMICTLKYAAETRTRKMTSSDPSIEKCSQNPSRVANIIMYIITVGLYLNFKFSVFIDRLDHYTFLGNCLPTPPLS